MKIFISADIEGCAGVASKPSVAIDGHDYSISREQMTLEVVAACEAAKEMGAEEIYVKDAHGSGLNIYPDKIPKGVILLREWSGDPRNMVDGLDETFDAVMYIGYHAKAGSDGNSLAHTMSSVKLHSIKVNGEIVSEFFLHNYIAAYYGVPSIMLSGDREVCLEGEKLVPGLSTAIIKDSRGALMESVSSEVTCERIKSAVTQALSKPNFKDCLTTLPKDFVLELTYKWHQDAYAYSFYPGCERIDPYTIRFQSNDWYEVARCLLFTM